MIFNWRLIGAAMAALAIFTCGWFVRGWKADSEIAALEKSHNEERVARQAAARQAVEQAEADGRAASVKYEARIREIGAASQKLRSEIRNAENNAFKAGAASCRLSGEWVRLYDDALRPGGGSPSPSGEPAGPPEGAGDAWERGAPTSEWDVAWVHAENSARWAECRAQLNALIDFSLGDGKAVVTP